MSRSYYSTTDDYNRTSSSLNALETQDLQDICKFFLKDSELSEIKKNEDLKLSDLLKYYLKESQSAKDLLYKRPRSHVPSQQLLSEV
jgi:sorting nexin-5/6/32